MKTILRFGRFAGFFLACFLVDFAGDSFAPLDGFRFVAIRNLFSEKLGELTTGLISSRERRVNGQGKRGGKLSIPRLLVSSYQFISGSGSPLSILLHLRHNR